ncbi:MerR family transcriptional regulator [Oerskovia sp. M15]
MRIGEVAHRAGVSTRALRYYEEQGLLTSSRTPSGQRSYPESAVERVQLIQQFFTAGLSSRTILQLLPCVDSGASSPRCSRCWRPSATASPPRWPSSPPHAMLSTA